MKNKRHLGYGYSDHLPIYASFSLKKENRNSLKKEIRKTINHISDLYNIENLNSSVIVKNVTVIYKKDNFAIIKEKNNRAIYLYKNISDLKLGYVYDIQINQIKNYNGLKEVTSFKIKKEYSKTNYKNLFLDGNKIDLYDEKYQNEIITNLKATYKKGHLYFKNTKIKLYAKNKKDLPKNNQKLTIITGHLSSYRGNTQIVIYKKSDYKEN